MKRRTTTRAEDARFLAWRIAEATRAWEPGDRCLAYRGAEETSVERVEGEIVFLANGESVHRSKMRSPK